MPMQRKTITITITDQMESWVKSQVDSGKYGNDSEYFRDLVRWDQERREAESNGVSTRSAQEIWDAAESRLVRNNR